ncbi:hypothetical protein GUJ93_ZPchr0068g2943 [Zizania palustris]|uniref:Uncharacterized protein n=1 Tax=Zizania palustris TaxID=103762 RepID=A0A8J5V364_ZIZPA|nr:hypothetical protein GUJ93_ZPchr0068g2943 [Zizania palustris]
MSSSAAPCPALAQHRGALLLHRLAVGTEATEEVTQAEVDDKEEERVVLPTNESCNRLLRIRQNVLMSYISQQFLMWYVQQLYPVGCEPFKKQPPMSQWYDPEQNWKLDQSAIRQSQPYDPSSWRLK